MLMRNAGGHTAVIVRRTREHAHIVPMKSGALALKKLTLAELDREWRPVPGYDCRAALEKFLAHGEQHGMTEPTAEALRTALGRLEGELQF